MFPGSPDFFNLWWPLDSGFNSLWGIFLDCMIIHIACNFCFSYQIFYSSIYSLCNLNKSFCMSVQYWNSWIYNMITNCRRRRIQKFLRNLRQFWYFSNFEASMYIQLWFAGPSCLRYKLCSKAFKLWGHYYQNFR